MLRTLIALSLMIGLLASGVLIYARLTAVDRPPDVYLIVIDTARADGISPYDPTRVTRNLERLAQRSEVYERAVTPMPITKPAHFSMFTSLYPREHGVTSNAISLPMRQVVLAEVMNESGYETAAFVSAAHLAEGSGAQQGFTTFDGPASSARQRRAHVTVPRAVEFLSHTDTDKPLFVWLHTFDPHQPYDPPLNFMRRLDADLAKRYPRMQWQILDKIAADNDGSIPKRILDHTIDLYLREIEYGDKWIGVFIDAIEKYRDLDNALIIVTSDHGECFENGIYFEHLDCLFEGAIRIPFLVQWPNQRVVGRSKRIVSHLDIAPTVLKTAGSTYPMPFSGAALQDLTDAPRSVLLQHPYIERNKAFSFRSYVMKVVGGDPVAPLVVEQEKFGLVTREWKYIRTGGTKHELYAMQPTPDEETNLAADHPEVVSALSRELDRMLEQHPPNVLAPQMLDEDLRKTLESLGYMR